MANPTKIAITDRAFTISLTPAQIATLAGQNIPTRYMDPIVDTYGAPTSGRVLVRFNVGDVISDATIITSILGVTASTADYPNGFLPTWGDAH